MPVPVAGTVVLRGLRAMTTYILKKLRGKKACLLILEDCVSPP